MRVLVAYATKHGATRGIAERVAERLRTHGHEVEAVPVTSVRDVAAYDAALVGSAVYFGSWLTEAIEFTRENVVALAERPVWLFGSGPTGTKALPEAKEIAEFVAAIRPRGHRTFFGALDLKHLSFGERVVARGTGAPEGDFRDWGLIDAWADEIAAALAEERAPRPEPVPAR